MQRGEHGTRRAGTVDHDGTQRRTDGRLEGGDPAVVDVDEIGEDTEHPGHPAQHLGPGAGALIVHLAGQRLGARLEAVPLALGGAQRLLGVAQTLLRLLGAAVTLLGTPGQTRVLAAQPLQLLRQLGRFGLQGLTALVDRGEPLVGTGQRGSLALERALQGLDAPRAMA